MDQAVAIVQAYLHEHWEVLRHAQIKDPALGVLAMFEKGGGGTGGPDHPTA